jgi:hypothetical protein
MDGEESGAEDGCGETEHDEDAGGTEIDAGLRHRQHRTHHGQDRAHVAEHLGGHRDTAPHHRLFGATSLEGLDGVGLRLAHQPGIDPLTEAREELAVAARFGHVPLSAPSGRARKGRSSRSAQVRRAPC